MSIVLEIKSNCIHCDNCRLFCPELAVQYFDQKYYVDPWSCTLCGICIEVCPVDCIKMIENQNSQPDHGK